MVEKWASREALATHSKGAALAAMNPQAGGQGGPARPRSSCSTRCRPGTRPRARCDLSPYGAERAAMNHPVIGTQGRVALVTGAARGIGAATVAALAADGWRVVAVDRCADDPALPYPLGSRDELDHVVEEAAGPAGVVAAQADARDPEALAAAVRLAEERWGGLDAAIAVAGVIAGGVPAWQVPLATEQAVLDIDLGGVLTLARVAVPALLRRPSRATAGSWPWPRPRPPAGCPCWPPIAPPRRGWPGSSARWASSSAAPGSPPTRSARARPPRPSWRRAPGSTAWPARPRLRRPAAARPAAGAGRGGRGAGLPGRGRRQRDDRRRRPGRRRPGPVTPRARPVRTPGRRRG